MANWTDEDTTTRSVLREARQCPRIPLSEADPAPTAGVYTLFLGPPARRRDRLAIYGPLLEGRHPIYHGSAIDLADRFRRHRRNLRATDGLAVDDLWTLWHRPQRLNEPPATCTSRAS